MTFTRPFASGAALVIASLLALGCAARGAPPVREAPLGSDGELVLGKAVRAAMAGGASEPRLALTGAGIPGDSVGGLVQLPPGECALLLARGAEGVQDVDVFAFADDGTILASDESPAKDASVLLCPPHAERAFVSARLAAGFGVFGVSVQMASVERASAVGRVFGVVSRPREARELDAEWPGLEQRLAEHQRERGGSWEVLRKVALPLDPRLDTSVSVLVEADRCVDLLVTPSEEVGELELDVLESSGHWIGSGRARGADRAIMVCSSETRELSVRCRPHAGRGLGALVIARSEVGAARRLGPHVARFDLRPEGALDELRAALGERLRSVGYGAGRLAHRGELPAQRRIGVPLALERGCSRVDVTTAVPVTSISASLWDDAGRLIAEDAQGSSAALFACGNALSARLDLETLARGGAFAVETRHTPRLPAAAARYPLAMSRLLALLDTRGALAGLDGVPEARVVEVSGTALARVPLEVEAGRCLEIAAALDREGSGLEVHLFEAARPALEVAWLDDATVGYGTYAASARVCAVEPARARSLTAELRANFGRGVALWASRTYEPVSSGGARAR